MLVQQIGTGIAAIDARGKQIDVNDAFCAMVGWRREELVGAEPPFCYWPAEARAETQAALELALAGRFPAGGMTLRFQRRDGERFPVLVLLTPFSDAERGTGWLANVVDLSPVAAKIGALERSERRLRVAQEAGRVGIWELDLATGDAWRSPECERINGFEPGSHPTQQQWLQRVHPEDRHLFEAPQSATLRDAGSFDVEFRIRLDSGEERWLVSRGRLQRDADGQPVSLVGINLDITERKRAEAELDRYHQVLEKRAAEHAGVLEERTAQLVRTYFALDRAGIGIAWNDAITGRFLYANDETCRQLGYRREELLRLTVADINPQFPIEAVRQMAAESREQGGRRTVETVHRRKDGSEYPAEVTMYIEQAGGHQQFVVFLNDVTGRVRLEQTLRASEQRWQFALEGAAQGVWDWNRQTGQVFYSPSYKRMLGYADDEFGDSDRDWSDRIHPDDLADTLDRVERHFRGEPVPYDIEFRMRCKDGHYAWIQSRGLIVERGAGGEPKRIIGTHTDITQRKLAEAALVDAKGELESTLESMGAGFFACDADWRFLYINAEGERLLGLQREEILGKSHWEVFPLTRGTKLAEAYRRAAAGEPQDFENYYEPWGRWFQNRCFPRRGGGMSVYFRDITEKKALDVALQAAKTRAEASSAAKTAFLANMSHEIRTPLNGIIGMAHLLRLGGLSDAQADRLDRLEHSAKHLLDVLNAVLDLSKIEAGKVVLANLPLRIESIVANTISIVEEAARRKTLRLHSDLDAFPGNLLGDAPRLQQALLNYVGNAVKFTERGSVTVRARLLREDGGDALVRFEVADTGVGIEPDVLPRLFTSFEQGDRSLTRAAGGTGLGLAITRKLAELMGGEAGVESQPGVGSLFWFTARCRKAADAEVEPAKPIVRDAAAALRRDHAGARVLLAEDNEINREVAVAILEHAGLAVDTAEDGEQAVAKAAAGAYALVLMDMQMPVMDGLGATREIRKRWPKGSLPIIAMTANAFNEDKALCYEAGMDDFLSKPVEPEQLYALLLGWLERARPATRPG